MEYDWVLGVEAARITQFVFTGLEGIYLRYAYRMESNLRLSYDLIDEPFLREKQLWQSVLGRSFQQLRAAGCSTYTGSANITAAA